MSRSQCIVGVVAILLCTFARRMYSDTLPQQVTSRKATFPVGYKTLREIVRLQRSTNFLIPRICFGRVVKALLWSIAGRPLRMQSIALEALHEAAEMVVISVLTLSYRFSRFANRVTLMKKDIVLTMEILEDAHQLYQSLS